MIITISTKSGLKSQYHLADPPYKITSIRIIKILVS